MAVLTYKVVHGTAQWYLGPLIQFCRKARSSHFRPKINK